MKGELNLVKVIEYSYPSDANFLLVKVDDADRRYQELLENGIVVRNRTKQTSCSNCLRFTIGSEQENNRLIKVLNELK